MNRRKRRLVTRDTSTRPSIKESVKKGDLTATEILADETIQITSPKLLGWLKRRAKKES